jgi:hypothetical protein
MDTGNGRAVTLRAVVIGLALVPVNVYWVLAAELRWYMVVTLNPLFVTPVFWLLLLVGGNALLRWRWPRGALRAGELLTIYVMLVLSCTIATHDYIINLVGGTLPWPAWFATPENRWERIMFPHLAKWLLVWDKAAIEKAMNGHASLYQAGHWRPWVGPLVIWGGFILTCGGMFLCLNALFRRAWIEHARLAFPVVRLPLAMLEPAAPRAFYRSGAMGAGFALSFGLALFNGLHSLYPFIPSLQTRARFLTFPTSPWNRLNGTTLSLYPFAVGLTFFVPLEVSFSCWFFYLFNRAQLVLGAVLGYETVRGYPFHTEQTTGSWMAYALILLFTTRGHLRQVWRQVGRPEAWERDEPLSSRWAVSGLLAGGIALFWFWHEAGMNALPIMVALTTYFLLALGITRARAEAGSQHTVWDPEPKNLFGLIDAALVGRKNLAGAALSHWFWRLNRSHIMPSQLEALKLAAELHVPPRRLVWPIVVATVAATIAAPWACLDILYRDGGLAKCIGYPRWCGVEAFNWLETALTQGFETDWNRLAAIGGGALFTGILFLLRARFTGFPFHPLGYCAGPGLYWLWFPFFLAWLCKALIVRYGGLRAYRRAIPFFLGLILGSYVSGACWALLAPLFGVAAFQVFH